MESTEDYIKDFERVMGVTPDAYADDLWRNRPNWASRSSLLFHDTRFLFKAAYTAGSDVAIEIGTATGFSAAVLCHALHCSSRVGIISEEYQVVTYDLSSAFFADPSRNTGDAAHEQLPAELLEHITFRNPALAADVQRDYGSGTIGFLFIDAAHRHPWPTLDLLATLDLLRSGATVVLHDINLPFTYPQFPYWGAKYLFDDLVVEKVMAHEPELPNIGSIRIPEDKGQMRSQLMRILRAHEWEAEMHPDYLARLGLSPN